MVVLDEPFKEIKILNNYIDGEWVEAKSNVFVDVVNPATMKTIGRVPRSNEEDVDIAVKAAKEAFPSWRRTTPLARSRYLFRLKDILEELEEGGFPPQQIIFYPEKSSSTSLVLALSTD